MRSELAPKPPDVAAEVDRHPVEHRRLPKRTPISGSAQAQLLKTLPVALSADDSAREAELGIEVLVPAPGVHPSVKGSRRPGSAQRPSW